MQYGGKVLKEIHILQNKTKQKVKPLEVRTVLLTVTRLLIKWRDRNSAFTLEQFPEQNPDLTGKVGQIVPMVAFSCLAMRIPDNLQRTRCVKRGVDESSERCTERAERVPVF